MPQPAAAQYPERTVDLVIPYAAGGGIDLLLRVLAEGFSAHFKQSFVVSNRTGAGGAIGVGYVARSAPDGYTLLFVPALVHSVLPLMQSNVGYTEKSFEPICQTFENQMALIVRPEFAVQVGARHRRGGAGEARRRVLCRDRDRHHHASRGRGARRRGQGESSTTSRSAATPT